ncbi:hypothetical protein DRI96_03650, partial [Candidatus Aerophobetes bacterium]
MKRKNESKYDRIIIYRIKKQIFSLKRIKHLPIYVILIWEEGKEDDSLLILTSLEVKDNNLQEIVSIY